MGRVAAAVGLMVMTTVLLASVAQAGSLEHAARALLENVLGEGVVSQVRRADGGATLLVRWSWASFRPGRTQALAREVLYTEALLATGSVLGRLPEVVRIRFTVLHEGRMVATGENRRGRGLALAFAPELGGGTYQETAPARRPATPGWDGTTFEQ